MLLVDVNEPKRVFEKLDEKGVEYKKTQIRIHYCKNCGKIYGLEGEDSCSCGYEVYSDRVGDFVDSELRYAVERKTEEDCTNSLRDYSLFEQARKMAMLFSGNKFVFLEGFISVMKIDPRNVKIRPWIKSIRTTLQQYGVVMWQMDDLDMLIYELIQLDKKCGEMPRIYDVIDDKYKGWSDQKKLTCKLIDVSDKKADLLLKKFKNPYNVFNTIINTDVLYTRTGNPKGVNGPFSDLKGFGYRFIEKNKRLLLQNGH